MGDPQNGWFIVENPIEMGDLGVPPFMETSVCGVGSKIVRAMVKFLHPRAVPMGSFHLPCAGSICACVYNMCRYVGYLSPSYQIPILHTPQKRV